METEYIPQDGYLIPNLMIPDEGTETRTIGKYGLMRENFLKNHREGTYCAMLLRCELADHLADIEEEACERVEKVVEALTAQFPPPDKEADIQKWAAHMNGLRAMAEEEVIREIICR